MPKDVDHLQNLVLVISGPPSTQCERESGGWVCVSGSSRKRQKVDTLALALRLMGFDILLLVRLSTTKPLEVVASRERM